MRLQTNDAVALVQLKDRLSNDGAGRRQIITDYIKAHEGETITLDEFKDMTGLKATGGASVHLRTLIKKGKIHRLAAGHNRFKYYPGRGVTEDRHRNSEVSITKPAAPVSKPQIEKMEAQGWDYIKSIVETEDNHTLGIKTKALAGFFEHLGKHFDD